MSPRIALGVAAIVLSPACTVGAPLDDLYAADPNDPGGAGPWTVGTLRGQTAVLAGQHISFTVFYPRGARQAPIAVLSHGFLQTGRDMERWGRHFATWGLVAAVPTWPHCSAAYVPANGASARALFDRLAADARSAISPFHGVAEGAHRALFGYSLGGEIVLAATSMPGPPLDVVVAIDPVDCPFSHAGIAAAKQVLSTVVLVASPPQMCNGWGGDTRKVFAALRGEKLLFSGPGLGHCDPEDPVTGFCKLFCGNDSLPARRRIRRLATAAILWRTGANRRMRALVLSDPLGIPRVFR